MCNNFSYSDGFVNSLNWLNDLDGLSFIKGYSLIPRLYFRLDDFYLLSHCNSFIKSSNLWLLNFDHIAFILRNQRCDFDINLRRNNFNSLVSDILSSEANIWHLDLSGLIFSDSFCVNCLILDHYWLDHFSHCCCNSLSEVLWRCHNESRLSIVEYLNLSDIKSLIKGFNGRLYDFNCGSSGSLGIIEGDDDRFNWNLLLCNVHCESLILN